MVGFPELVRSLWDNWRRDVFMATFGALLGVAGVGTYQCAIAEAQQAALRELIRAELDFNASLLSSGRADLRRSASALERFLAGDSPAPTLPVGYPGLATVGLHTQLESPSVFHADHRILVLYSFLSVRLVRFGEVQRTLDAAAFEYRAALNLEEERRAAAHLLAVIRYQLSVSTVLASRLPVLIACIDQFSAGQDECKYALADIEPADALGDDRP